MPRETRVVKVKPNAKSHQLEEQPDGSFIAYVKVPPIDGKANQALIELMAARFGVPKSHIRIKLGQTSRNKVVEILTDENP
ncbi:MAG: DUF167 domain-containing protein [Scytolyngbya sp. HA4215-MV1]|jgi:hypothetical protein|nr:DUF167 domain-containing protein [Scytolyngbya sp. HA4215-MV1]